MGLAAYLGHAEVVGYLIESGADVNAVATNGTGFTALTGAVSHKHVRVAEILLAHGADAKHRYEGGSSPLIEAAFNGHEEMVKLLLAHGADPSARTQDGKTALTLAFKKGHQDVVALLREHGAK